MTKTFPLYYRHFGKQYFVSGAVAAVCLAASACAFSASNPWSQNQVIQPATLAKQLQKSGDKPLLLQVGFERLYAQGHIPGSKYCGPARSADGIARLKTCLQGVSHTRAIVLYCGCCPWEECPNIRPAFKAVKEMGFSNVKVLYIEGNLGRDWAHKGYPSAAQ
jgi:thiosulfate/3-mercaptopyruvate sulfurtransferase